MSVDIKGFWNSLFEEKDGQSPVIEPQVEELTDRAAKATLQVALFRALVKSLPNFVWQYGPNAVIAGLNRVQANSWWMSGIKLFVREYVMNLSHRVLAMRGLDKADDSEKKEAYGQEAKGALEDMTAKDFDMTDMSFAEMLGWIRENRLDVYAEMDTWFNGLTADEYAQLAKQLGHISSVLEIIGVLSVRPDLRLEHLDDMVTSKKERGLGGRIAEFFKQLEEPLEDDGHGLILAYRAWNRNHEPRALAAEAEYFRQIEDNGTFGTIGKLVAGMFGLLEALIKSPRWLARKLASRSKKGVGKCGK